MIQTAEASGAPLLVIAIDNSEILWRAALAGLVYTVSFLRQHVEILEGFVQFQGPRTPSQPQVHRNWQFQPCRVVVAKRALHRMLLHAARMPLGCGIVARTAPYKVTHVVKKSHCQSSASFPIFALTAAHNTTSHSQTTMHIPTVSLVALAIAPAVLADGGFYESCENLGAFIDGTTAKGRTDH